MYDIVTLEKQWIKGLSVRTTNEIEQTKERKIAPLWQEFFTQQLHGGQAPVIGLYSDYEKDEHGSYLFTAGQFADQQIEHVKEIPASTYARFRTRKDRLKRSCLKHGTRFGRGISVNTALIQVILNGMMKDLLIQKKRKLTFILRLMKK